LSQTHMKGKTDSQPLVSVITPFYNTEQYLSECIESVLRQSYGNFEYILLNNCSTDRSLEIAEKYAKQDRRIRLINNSEFLNQVGNYNRALRMISPQSKYCKIVQADDWIYPECLEKMVSVAEENPSVGIVSGYYLRGKEIGNVGLPYSTRILPGRDICRKTLLEGGFFFGNPTSILVRADIVRERNPFYAEGRLHEDTEACYEILRDKDFGFVHQVLSFMRVDNVSISSAVRNLDPNDLDLFIVLNEHGPYFLTEAEFRERLKAVMKIYFTSLAKKGFLKMDKRYWAYHEKGLRTVGYCLRRRDLIPYVLIIGVDVLLNPKMAVERLLRSYKRRKKTEMKENYE